MSSIKDNGPIDTTTTQTYHPQQILDHPDVVDAVAKLREVAYKFEDMKVSGTGKVSHFDIYSGQMAGIHLLLYNALAQQYKIASLYLSKEDGFKPFEGFKLDAWVKYCLMGVEFIEHHHENEEKWLFPQLSKLKPEFKVLGDANIAQHKEFHESLHALIELFKPLQPLSTMKSTKSKSKPATIHHPDPAPKSPTTTSTKAQDPSVTPFPNLATTNALVTSPAVVDASNSSPSPAGVTTSTTTSTKPSEPTFSVNPIPATGPTAQVPTSGTPTPAPAPHVVSPPHLSPKSYDPIIHLKILDVAIPIIIKYLADELDTISRQTLESCGFSERELRKVWDDLEGAAKKGAALEELILVFGHSETAWLPIPKLVKTILQMIYTRKNKDLWKLCPYPPYPSFSKEKVDYPAKTPVYQTKKMANGKAKKGEIVPGAGLGR